MNNEDGIETIIGAFGKYQTFIFILVTLGRYPTEFQLVNVVFILPNVQYKCLDNSGLVINGTNVCPCENPEYDNSTIISSITSEFNLICERSYLASWAQSMLQVGVLPGSLMYGFISDRYGRKKASVLAFFLCALFVTISAFVTQFWMFLVCRFLIGTAVGGTMLCSYVMIIELCGKSFRPYMIGILEIGYVSGYFAMGVIASYVREWRYLQMVTSTPWLLVLAYFWIIPESPRWLITVGKKKEAIEVLTYIANKNNKPQENIVEIVNEIEKNTLLETKQRGSYLDLFRTPKIEKYSFLMAAVWLCCAHAHFGINQSIGNLPGNLYTNVMMSAACHVPALFIITIATLHLKRKLSVMTAFFITAVSIFIVIFIPQDAKTVTLVLAIIGAASAFSSFVLIYLYTTEIFPTVVRNSAMGFVSVFARVGGFIAPFVVNIEGHWPSLTVFGSSAALAALFCFFLPETKDVVLLNSILQAEKT